MYNLFNPQLVDMCARIIQTTYNTFNGVINPVNKSGGLLMLPQRSEKLAYMAYMNKKVLYIYILNLIMNYDPYILDFQCLFTVLHELSHFDQAIDSERYRDDTAYRDFIENANDAHTMQFIVANINTVNQILGKTVSDYDLSDFAMSMLAINSADYTMCYERTNIARVYAEVLDKYYHYIYNQAPDLEDILKHPSRLDVFRCIVFEIRDLTDGTVWSYPMRSNYQWNPNTQDLNINLFNRIIRYDQLDYTMRMNMSDDLREITFTILVKSKIIYPFKAL